MKHLISIMYPCFYILVCLTRQLSDARDDGKENGNRNMTGRGEDSYHSPHLNNIFSQETTRHESAFVSILFSVCFVRPLG